MHIAHTMIAMIHDTLCSSVQDLWGMVCARVVALRKMDFMLSAYTFQTTDFTALRFWIDTALSHAMQAMILTASRRVENGASRLRRTLRSLYRSSTFLGRCDTFCVLPFDDGPVSKGSSPSAVHSYSSLRCDTSWTIYTQYRKLFTGLVRHIFDHTGHHNIFCLASWADTARGQYDIQHPRHCALAVPE